MPQGFFIAHYSRPFLNTELLIFLWAFPQQSSLLYLGASQSWNNLSSQCLDEVRGYCNPTWTDGKQIQRWSKKTKIFECLGLVFCFLSGWVVFFFPEFMALQNIFYIQSVVPAVSVLVVNAQHFCRSDSYWASKRMTDKLQKCGLTDLLSNPVVGRVG